jgi:hypothetical protein
MPARFLTILTGRNLPKIQQVREHEPSTIDEKAIANFIRVDEQTGILKQPTACTVPRPDAPICKA